MTPPRILDRRRFATRAVLDLWRRWDERSPAAMTPLTALTRPFVRAGLRRRLSSRDVPPPRPWIVSVGALASGGSGKTPVTIDLARELIARGLDVAVICRGYGSATTGPLRVDPADGAYGDEARLIAARLPDARVIQAADRRAGLAVLRDGASVPDLILLEDGHQCAGAGRHLDILILDRWRDEDGRLRPCVGHLLPWGPYREDVSGAARAGLWLLPLREGEAPPPSASGHPRRLGFRRRSRLPADVADVPDSSYGVVCGIADPAGFETACAGLCGRPPEIAARFDDHARYGAADVAEAVALGARLGVRRWLTTAKDHVKLERLWPADAPTLKVVELDLDWVGDPHPADIVLSILED